MNRKKIAAMSALGAMLSLPALPTVTESARPAPKMIRPHANPAGTSWAAPLPKMKQPTPKM